MKNDCINFHSLLIYLWPGNWQEQLEYIYSMVIEDKQAVHDEIMMCISESEFWMFF